MVGTDEKDQHRVYRLSPPINTAGISATGAGSGTSPALTKHQCQKVRANQRVCVRAVRNRFQTDETVAARWPQCAAFSPLNFTQAPNRSDNPRNVAISAMGGGNGSLKE
jgi:hypothetical protein